MCDTALLVIDLQRDFLEANGRLPIEPKRVPQVITSANCLLDHAKSVGWNVILIVNSFPKSDWLGNFFRKKAAIEGTPGAEIDPRIQVPTAAVTITKTECDSFSNPRLESMLKDAGIRRLIILGVMTEACVCDTAKSGIRLGFKTVVVSDAVAASTEADHRRGLERMRAAGARFVSCEELVKAV